MNDTDARRWHPWLRINRVPRVMLHTRSSAEAWSEIKVEFRKALALRTEIRRRGARGRSAREEERAGRHQGLADRASRSP